jgi:hypothetical protein
MRICGKEEHMEGQGIHDGNGKKERKLKGNFEEVWL